MFLHHLVEFANNSNFELVHKWHGINVLIVLECLLILALFWAAIAVLAAVKGFKKLKLTSIIASLTFVTAAYAANTSLSNLSASGAIAAANLIYVVQTPGSGGVKATFTQVATFINSLFSGDATVASGGAITLATVNANVGTFGSATNCVTFTTNAKGLITAASQATCTPAIASVTGLGTGVATALAVNIGSAGAPVLFNGAGGTPSSLTLTNATGLPIGGITGTGTGVAAALAAALNSSTGLVGALTATNGNCVVGNGTAWTSAACPGGTAANPTATAGPTAVNGVASTYMRSDAAPAVQQGSSSVKGIVQVDGTTITASSGVISAVNNGTVTSVGASCGNVAAPNPITTSGTIDAGITIRTVSTTTDTIVAADCGNLVNYTNAGSVAVTLPQAGTAGFATRAFFQFCTQGAGTTTITPTTSTIGGAATKTLTGGTAAAPVCTGVISDGTNYQLVPSSGGGGTPGGSSGQIQYNNAGAFGGFTMAGDATINTSTGAVTTVGEHPGYVSGSWNGPTNVSIIAPGTSGAPANHIACRLQVFPRLVTVDALGVFINTVGTTNLQLAIYSNTASNRPGTLIGNTGSIANTSTGAVSGALAANKQVGPGGADGGKYNWLCVNQNDSTVQYIISNNGSVEFAGRAGSATLSDFMNGSGNDGPGGVVCNGAACQGGSSTFGTWPASLDTTTWSMARPSTTGNFIPVVFFRAN